MMCEQVMSRVTRRLVRRVEIEEIIKKRCYLFEKVN